MKLIHQFAMQYQHGGVWQPIQPRWYETEGRIVTGMRFQNKLDYEQKQAVPRRLLHRVVSEPEEIGVRWASGKNFKITEAEAANRKAIKEALCSLH